MVGQKVRLIKEVKNIYGTFTVGHTLWIKQELQKFDNYELYDKDGFTCCAEKDEFEIDYKKEKKNA